MLREWKQISTIFKPFLYIPVMIPTETAFLFLLNFSFSDFHFFVDMGRMGPEDKYCILYDIYRNVLCSVYLPVLECPDVTAMFVSSTSLFLVPTDASPVCTLGTLLWLDTPVLLVTVPVGLPDGVTETIETVADTFSLTIRHS